MRHENRKDATGKARRNLRIRALLLSKQTLGLGRFVVDRGPERSGQHAPAGGGPRGRVATTNAVNASTRSPAKPGSGFCFDKHAKSTTLVPLIASPLKEMTLLKACACCRPSAKARIQGKREAHSCNV